jgi:hypothetical protein
LNRTPHPLSLSRREQDEKPFSLREKGGDEGITIINTLKD